MPGRHARRGEVALPDDVTATGTRLILANTYHSSCARGTRSSGSWAAPPLHGLGRAILTDSGGFQVFSLAGLRRITDAGVSFKSHLDGSDRFLSPEIAMEAQRAFGLDIAMVLDEFPPATADRAYVEQSMAMTTRWRRDARGDEGLENNTFGIVQGGFHEDPACGTWRIAAMPPRGRGRRAFGR